MPLWRINESLHKKIFFQCYRHDHVFERQGIMTISTETLMVLNHDQITTSLANMQSTKFIFETRVPSAPFHLTGRRTWADLAVRLESFFSCSIEYYIVSPDTKSNFLKSFNRTTKKVSNLKEPHSVISLHICLKLCRKTDNLKRTEGFLEKNGF